MGTLNTTIALSAAFVLVGLTAGALIPGARRTATVPARHEPVTVPTASAPLRLKSFNCEFSYGFTTVAGEVTNTTEEPIDNLVAVANHYTSDGVFVKSDTALVEYNPLMPGQTSPFRVMSTYNPVMTKCTVAFKQMFGGAVAHLD